MARFNPAWQDLPRIREFPERYPTTRPALLVELSMVFVPDMVTGLPEVVCG